MKHTKEPWLIGHETVNKFGVLVFRIDQNEDFVSDDVAPLIYIADVYGDRETADRIVECVNALAGIDNPKEYLGELTSMIQELITAAEQDKIDYSILEKARKLIFKP